MQNNHERSSNSGGFRKFLQEKGYYIALFLCVAAVGVAGVVFLSGALAQDQAQEEPTLSVATQAQLPSSQGSKPAQTKPAPSKPTAQPVTNPAEEAPAAQTDREDSEAVSASANLDYKARVWPVSGEPVYGYSAQALSYNTTTRDWRTHEGIDLAAQPGTPVVAAAAGTVTAVYGDEYLGTTVVLTHPGGYASHYANLESEPAVAIGQTVQAGQVVGTVGDTALLESGTQSHLHFAVFLAGEPVDPNSFIG